MHDGADGADRTVVVAPCECWKVPTKTSDLPDSRFPAQADPSKAASEGSFCGEGFW